MRASGTNSTHPAARHATKATLARMGCRGDIAPHEIKAREASRQLISADFAYFASQSHRHRAGRRFLVLAYGFRATRARGAPPLGMILRTLLLLLIAANATACGRPLPPPAAPSAGNPPNVQLPDAHL